MSEKPYLSYRQESKKEYTGQADINHLGRPVLDIEQLQLGALLRIADGMDKMAENYDRIISDRNMYKRWYEEEREKHAELKRKYRALKGQLTKCKKLINHEQA